MSTLYSARWHRVAGLRPRLAATVRVRRQPLRGERWIVLADATGGRSVRLNATAYRIAGRLDGRVTVQQLWDRQLAQPGEPATQDEIIDMLAQLRESALVQFDRAADFDLLLPHLERLAAPRRARSLLAWRLPLVDPSAALDRLQGLAQRLFTRSGLLAWLLAVGVLLALLLLHAPALWAFGERWLATPRFALLAALLYVPIKLVHEFAHGLAVRRWGGAVHEAGVTLMLGLPVPFVDASAASAFRLRRQRVIVGAAGLMAELVLAAVALPLWLLLGDGPVRDAAFVTLAIAGVSTLLFNANPLQRLDGYYIATDLLELPNLAPRSGAWWLDLLQRRLLRLPGVEPMVVASGETPWLAVYAPASWLYGVGIAALAVAWLGQVSLALGLLAGAWLGWQVVLQPAWRLVRRLRRAALAREGTLRRWRGLVFGGVAALVLVLVLPLPQRVLVAGVVWPADDAQLRADEDGFVDTVVAGDGARVAAGDLVLQLANPGLSTRLERQRARVEAIETELFNALPNAAAADGSALGDRRAELAAAQAELERLLERAAALALRARAAGRVALPQAADLGGRFVHRGQLLGQVLGAAPASVRVAMLESDASELRLAQGSASVRLASAPAAAQRATLVRDGGGATKSLPSAALSARHGGDIPTDPADDLKALQPVVLLDLRLDAAAEGRERLGERAWVRLDTGFAPLALQAARALRRQVLRRFNPQF